MGKVKHIIHKLVLQIEVPRRSAAQKVQDDAVLHFEQVLLKQLERLLDEIDVSDHLLIDKIDLDLGKGKLEDVLNSLPASLSKALDAVINPLMLADMAEEETEIRHLSLTDEQKAFDVFVYFITTGRLPWYAVTDTYWLQQEELWIAKITSVLARDSFSRSELTRVFENSITVISRLFKQFSSGCVKKIVAALLEIKETELQKAVELITRGVKSRIVDQQINPPLNTGNIASRKNEITDGFNTQIESPIIEKILLSVYMRTGRMLAISEEVLKKISALIIAEIRTSTTLSTLKLIEIADAVLKREEQSSIPQKNKPTITPDKTSETNPIQKEDEGGVYISQAGLVILHPFLEYFFKDFGLLQNNDFVDLHARQLAVHLLHYLGTGNTNAFEYDLYFEKFLCRWPADEPLEREVEIPQKMLDEGDNMLLTVIKYWKALKNTSPGGLREGFLNRNGKLIETEQPVRLIVERMDMDILLSTLPWGMGVIKLPWMVEPFYVEWK